MTPAPRSAHNTFRLRHRMTADAFKDLGLTDPDVLQPKRDAAMMVVAAGSAGKADPPAGKRQRDWRTSHA